MSHKYAKVLMANWSEMCRTDYEYFMACPASTNWPSAQDDETNPTFDLSRWYFLIKGVKGENNEFEGGEYLVELHVPKNYPVDPPTFQMLTPNGMWKINTSAICTSIGHYHSQNYAPGSTIAGFMMAIVSALCCRSTFGTGVGHLRSTDDECKLLAKNSAEFNEINYADIIKRIKTLHDASSHLRQAEKERLSAIESKLASMVVKKHNNPFRSKNN